MDRDILFTSTINISGVTTVIKSSTSAALDGNNTVRLFSFENGAQVSISGIVLKNGYVSGDWWDWPEDSE